MAESHDLFPGFETHWIDTGAGKIFTRSGGSGPPLVLLHGFPQTHAAFHRVAGRLAEHFSVVLMDLRGYGWSAAPPGDADHVTYSKREMAKDVIAVMEKLGHARFALAGHDRGARVGYRLALDHPGRLSRLVLLDILPTFFVWQQIEEGVFPAAHWEFLARPAPEPEDEIKRHPLPYFDGLLAKWSKAGNLSAFDPRALASYHASCNEPTRIHAFCEDYRAGRTVDVAQDRADLAAGRTIDCPVQAIWGEFYLVTGGTDPLDVWRRTFAPKAVGSKVPSAHFVVEEAPAEALAAMIPFLEART
ncbi:alpha/beta hydrolase [Chelatococcus sp. SYSU_G07232]|uniref:Alpha/beta hydrolase n=1 Tax=Chelatococcus albus TaxID=3047466 RepID=A0ABT7AG98_9HYPH|nr:alpha/beta hydrolase [Chelatococcus sp. SYSU_G07232]MDJ1157869.1 alpha/beta hydrolase [Chelatococcus sp. SYSU_G07232]